MQIPNFEGLKKTRVLFVCLGNICRSPLAEALFLKKAMERDVTHVFEVDSAGTSDYHIGELPDARTLRNARDNGIALTHLGRQFQRDDFGRFDHILAMDAENLRNILRLARTEEEKRKVVLMRNYDPDYHGADVPDPWFGGEAGFQVVFEILDRCTENLINEVLRPVR